jgi:hypothetical protein
VALFEERDLARWGREARAWLIQEDRRRTIGLIGLIVLSVAISIATSLIATAVVGLVAKRRAGVRGEVLPADVGEPLAEVAPVAEAAVGVPVMAAEEAVTGVEPTLPVGA